MLVRTSKSHHQTTSVLVFEMTNPSVMLMMMRRRSIRRRGERGENEDNYIANITVKL